MKKRGRLRPGFGLWAGFLLLACSGLSACDPVFRSSGESSAQSPGTFFYVPNSTGSSISGYSWNSSAGALTPLRGFPVPLPDSRPEAVAGDPRGRYLFVGETAANRIGVFSVDRVSGALSRMGQVTANSPRVLLVHPQGRVLYSIGGTSGSQIEAFSVSEQGALSVIPGSPYGPGGDIRSITMDASGSDLFAASPSANGVYSYRIDAMSGALAVQNGGTPFAAGSGNVGPISIVQDPKGQFLVTVNGTDSSLTLFSVNGGSLTRLQNQLAAFTAPEYGAFSPDGRYLYIGSSGWNPSISIHVFDRAASSIHAFVQGQTFQPDTLPYSTTSFVFDPYSTPWALLTQAFTGQVLVASFDPANGTLTRQGQPVSTEASPMRGAFVRAQ